METPIFIGLSRQIALRANMDIIANNVANMSTPGYRAQNMVFTEFLASPDGQEKLEEKEFSMVLDYGQFENSDPGEMRFTGNPLDAAIEGPGYFGVQTPEGVMYTRAGNFQVNTNGELVTGMGQLVADAGGGNLLACCPQGWAQLPVAGTLCRQSRGKDD